MQTFRSPFARYGIALVFVGIALCLSLAFQGIFHEGFVLFFLCAVMLAGWFGRTGPGLVAVFVSMVAVAYFFIPPYRALAVELDEIPYFLSFLLSAIVSSGFSAARRHAEERQRAHLDELFEETPEAIMLVDLQDRVLRVNKEFSRLFGYRLDEAVNRSSLDLIIPMHLRSGAVEAREKLERGQTVNLETTRQRRDGSLVEVSEVSFPVLVNGRSIAYYTIFRDITARKRAIEDLQKAQADLARLSRITTMGELASSIAHEINQPIAAISINGEAAVRWLAMDPPYLQGAGEAVRCMARDADRAGQVIGKIRSLLQKDPGPMVQLDVNDVIREVLLLMNHETNRRKAIIVRDLTEPIPAISGDRVQLQQVLLNLIMNSLDAMDSITVRPRQLVIRSSSTHDTVTVRVEDSGKGWDVLVGEKIFDPFFTTKKDGIGMGLTISRSIVELHGGRLWAEPAIPHGAVLMFTLPIAGNAP